MNARSRAVPHGLAAGTTSTTRCVRLDDGWSATGTTPGRWPDPGATASDASVAEWSPITVPGTVAAALAPGADLENHEDYDASDWWYRCEVTDPRGEDDVHARVRLRFDGLATLAEVWFNGEMVLTSTNMHLAYDVDVTDLLREKNDLFIVFRSLGSALSERRPRPRWKTNLVENQKLRWFRTTLLGRIPGWTPAIPAVGPWRPVWCEVIRGPEVESLRLIAGWSDQQGTLELRARGSSAADSPVESAALGIGGREFALEVVDQSDGRWEILSELTVDGVEPWWPRTHGDPQLYDCTIELKTAAGPVTIAHERVGFRSVALDDVPGRVQIVINGVPIFCRGACWTTNDIVSLVGAPTEMRRTLELAAHANANMIRVGGTMVYETDDFYRACDELGLMVWQDFMFANMDYPVGDEAFRTSVDAEARQQVARISAHPSVVAWCGGSEVEQQAAMFGAPKDTWTNDFFSESLPSLLEEAAPEATYWPSTPTGGTLPFHTGEGLTHYYGVGAYRRPIEDCRLSKVKFTPECLGFSNLPEQAAMRGLFPGGTPAPHDPRWKTGVPRDTGAGWDFEDVRDHYLAAVYGVDAVELRSQDIERYHRLSRVVTGRVMSQVFDEWRSPEHPCSGGLVWFLRDVRPGAGWGIIDSGNRPKPAYWYLKRAWSPVRVAVLDRGLDGLRVEVHNETATLLEARLDLTLLGDGARVLVAESAEIAVESRSTVHLSVEEVAGRFADPNYAYRFGPREVEAVSVSLESLDASVRCSTVWWPDLSEPLPRAKLEARREGGAIRIEADGLTRDVSIETSTAISVDNYFDLTPSDHRELSAVADTDPVQGYVSAENARDVRFPS